MVNRRVAVLGLSEGNGHPFSFSAIINGYDDEAFARAGWPVIHEYLRRRHVSEFGIPGLSVTHAWTPDPEVTCALAAACRIPHAVSDLDSLPDQVDAAIIARDDYQSHWRLARPFLERGLPVFIDKPLTLDVGELQSYRRYLTAGQLMSCSGMRYATELDEPRAALDDYGTLRLIRGAVVLSLEKYGIHIIDAVLNVVRSRPVRVSPHGAVHESVAIEMDDGSLFLLDALGAVPKTFRVELFGDKRTSTHDVSDNFGMFRRALWHFGRMVETRIPPIPPEHTIDTMRTLIACTRACAEHRRIDLDDIRL
jgi:predicted dehydrogenase